MSSSLQPQALSCETELCIPKDWPLKDCSVKAVTRSVFVSVPNATAHALMLLLLTSLLKSCPLAAQAAGVSAMSSVTHSPLFQSQTLQLIATLH